MAPTIHRSTRSNQDCRRGCAERSNSRWRLPGPKHTVMISCVYDRSCVYDHPRTLKMVPKENIIDNALRTTTDVNQDLANRYGRLPSHPMTLLIDRNGKISESHAGMVDKDAFENKIKALLHDSPAKGTNRP